MGKTVETSHSGWVIFTDGASSGNPGPGGWGSILISPDQEVAEIGGRASSTTNNRMEMLAAIEALKHVQHSALPCEIYTDSTYLIRGITQWIWGWLKRNWVTAEGKEVLNADLWKELLSLVRGKNVKWNYVRGHTGIPGNERADEIAVTFSQNRSPSLFRGPLNSYSIRILDLPTSTELPPQKNHTASATQDVTYLSLVDNTLIRHKTWKECEQRVRGRSGAKFKKVTNKKEEEDLLRSWGFKKEDVRD